MSREFPAVDPEGLLEYSVVFTDRSVNHMSQLFQRAMRELSAGFKQAYGAAATIVVPGGGSFGMEAVARQFAGGKRCLVVRNGWFSYRWSQILDMGSIASYVTVLKARQQGSGDTAPFAPPPIEEVERAIAHEKPEVVFAPHVETASGIILPDDYLERLAAAAHGVGAMFVLDCVASGAVWVDMKSLGVDVLISAPQKGWSSTPCAALVLLGPLGLERLEQTKSSSFSADLNRWLQIIRAYENGGHAYHATLPTDGLLKLHHSMKESFEDGLDKLRDAQWRLGQGVRALLEAKGFRSVAAEGFQAPGVVVSHTDDADISSGKAFAAHGMQSAAGVPLMCDEPEGFRTFRLGLFGLDKLRDVEGATARLRAVVDAIA